MLLLQRSDKHEQKLYLLARRTSASLAITTTLYDITTRSRDITMANWNTLSTQNTPNMATPIAATSPANHTATET
jgi:hypothetical protein